MAVPSRDAPGGAGLGGADASKRLGESFGGLSCARLAEVSASTAEEAQLDRMQDLADSMIGDLWDNQPARPHPPVVLNLLMLAVIAPDTTPDTTSVGVMVLRGTDTTPNSWVILASDTLMDT